MTDSVKPVPADLEKMDGTSLDIAEQRRRELKQLLPGVFTETPGSDGQPVETIDFERLKAELGTFSDVYEGRRERYGMEWPGKRDCMKLIQEPSRATLKPCREESVDFDTTQNLFIEGDNLEVLKLLQKSYYGKVKMIYIDPPYNTGNEFIYPDKYSESLETYLAYAGLVDDEGKKFSTNTATEGRFHTRWPNMMFPRLYLARNLLREDGVVFISIDDNEVENLRRMCDEIFGEENFLANVVWQKTYSPANDKKGIDAMHDYVLCYRKTELFENKLLPRTEQQNKAYQNPDDDPRGPWKPVDSTRAEHRDYAYYPIVTPSGREVFPAQGRSWVFTKEEVDGLIHENRLWFGKDGNSKPSIKRFLTEVKDGLVPTTWWSHEFAGHNDEAKKEVKKLFPDINPFSTPKPTRLIERLAQITLNEGDVCLDFFAGSCTTAHALMKYVVQERKAVCFIMVQLPEPLEKESEQYKAGYKNIADIGKERIRRAARNLSSTVGNGIDEDEIPGFGLKVLKLDESNFRQWCISSSEASEQDLVQKMEAHIVHIEQGVSQETILYELLLKAGFKPTDKIDELMLLDKRVFSIADGALLICLEEELTSELIDAVADREPMQFICLDKGFKGNDQLKANAVQTFKSRSQGAETEMVFKVV